MKKTRIWFWRLSAGVALLILVSSAVLALRTRPLPGVPIDVFSTPSFDKLPKISACWIEFDQNSVPGQLATAGFTRMPNWELTTSGLLIRHSHETLLIDTGNSSHFQEEIAGYPFWSHLHFEILSDGKSSPHSAADVLRASGIDPTTLWAVLPSHIHMDHVGGLMDIPNVPVLLSQDEMDFMERNRDTKTIQVVAAHAKTIEGRMRPLRFEANRYEIFDESADIFGDGSVVAVKLPGHTPGSVGVFINVSPTQRIFHVGDAVNVTEAVDRRLSKSIIMATTDNDSHRADLTVATLYELRKHDPRVAIIPAHDRAAWKSVFGSTPRCIP